MRWVTGLFFLAIFSFSFVSRSFADSHVTLNDSESKVENVYEGNRHERHSHHSESNEGCHCPVHEVMCCAQAVIVQKNAAFELIQKSKNLSYNEQTRWIKPSPFLDGPYLPPRA